MGSSARHTVFALAAGTSKALDGPFAVLAARVPKGLTMDDVWLLVCRFWLLGLPCAVPVYLAPNLHPLPWDLPLTVQCGPVELTERAASSCLGFSSGCADSVRICKYLCLCLCLVSTSNSMSPIPTSWQRHAQHSYGAAGGSSCQRASTGPCLVQMVSQVVLGSGCFPLYLALLVSEWASKCCGLSVSCMYGHGVSWLTNVPDCILHSTLLVGRT